MGELIGRLGSTSAEERRAAGATKRSLYLHAVRRGIILFVLGIVLQGRLLAWNLDKLRPCYSVLHGIAAGYLIAFAVALELRPRTQGAVLALLLLALFYWIIDVKGFRRWAFFFTVIGMNSIAAYTATMLARILGARHLPSRSGKAKMLSRQPAIHPHTLVPQARLRKFITVQVEGGSGQEVARI